MAWLWSSSKPTESATQPAPAAAPTSTPPSAAIPANAQPDTTEHPDAGFYASNPHLAPPTAPSSQPPQQPEYDPEYPITMSCRAAFDSAFYCASLGGHFNHVYRYGELRSCSEHWADWRFCMGLKTRPKAEKEAMIQERYRQKEEKLRSQPNSERVWDKIPEGQRHLGAFKPQ